MPITISLKGVGHKLLFTALVLAPSAFFLRAAARPWLADRIASAQTLAALRLAARYEPANAERYYALARFAALTGGPEAAADAASNLHAAAELNPHRGRYWLELARALRLQDDFIGEGVALRQAIQHDPANVLLAEDAAAFFLARGETADALREYRLVIEHDAKKAPAVYNELWNHTHDAGLLFDKALPPAATYHAPLMRLLIRDDQQQAAAELWRRWMTLPADLAASPAFPYIEYLCRRGDYDTAAQAWTQLTAHSSEIRARKERGNLLLNGDFENPMLDGGFEWRARHTALASLNLDTVRFHSGSSSLRIDFTGQPGDDSGIAQLLVLPANTAVNFRGFMRAEEVFTTHGPRFTITDVATGAPLFVSEESVGTTLWLERYGTVPAASVTRLVVLQVTREAEGHITGRAWIDDLSLTPVGQP